MEEVGQRRSGECAVSLVEFRGFYKMCHSSPRVIQKNQNPDAGTGLVHLINVILATDFQNFAEPSSVQLFFNVLYPLLSKKQLKLRPILLKPIITRPVRQQDLFLVFIRRQIIQFFNCFPFKPVLTYRYRNKR